MCNVAMVFQHKKACQGMDSLQEMLDTLHRITHT